MRIRHWLSHYYILIHYVYMSLNGLSTSTCSYFMNVQLFKTVILNCIKLRNFLNINMIPLQLRNFGKYGSSKITDRVAIECWLIRKNFFVLFLVNILLTVEPLIKFLSELFS